MLNLLYNYDVDMTANKTYYLKKIGKYGHRKVLSEEARSLRARIMCDTEKQLKCPNGDLDLEEPQRVIIFFFNNWLTKDDNLKKIDLDNRLKFLIDSIYNTLGADDKFIVKLTAEKIQTDGEPKCLVMIMNHDFNTT